MNRPTVTRSTFVPGCFKTEQTCFPGQNLIRNSILKSSQLFTDRESRKTKEYQKVRTVRYYPDVSQNTLDCLYERTSSGVTREHCPSVLDFQLSHRQRFTVFPRQSYLFGNVSTRSIHSRNLGLKNAFLSFQFFSSDSVKIEIF